VIKKIPGKKASYEIPIAISLRGFASFGFDFFHLLFYSLHFFFSLNNFLSVCRSPDSGSGGVSCFHITCDMKWIDICSLTEADYKRSPPETPFYILRHSTTIEPQRFAVSADYCVTVLREGK